MNSVLLMIYHLIYVNKAFPELLEGYLAALAVSPNLKISSKKGKKIIEC